MNNKTILKTDEELLTKNPNNTKIQEVHEIEDTPFTIIKINETYMLVMGKYKLGTYETKQEAEIDAKNTSWNRLLEVIMIVVTDEIKTNNEKLNKQ